MTAEFQELPANGKGCDRCKIFYSFDCFEKDSHSADNYRRICKRCRAFLRGRSDVDPAAYLLDTNDIPEVPQEATGGQLSSLRTPQAVIGSHGIRLTRTSLTLPPGITFAQWQECMEEAQVWDGSVRWWLGDMLQQGESRFSEEYTQAIGTSAYQTYANCKWVAGRFADVSRRRENLSWSHHETVAGLEPSEADAYLTEAETEGWSVAKLRAVKKEREQAVQQTPTTLTIVENAPDAANNIRQAAQEPSEALQTFFADDEIASGDALAREAPEDEETDRGDLTRFGFNEMQETIGKWGELKFPDQTSRSIHAHLRKELKEMLEVVEGYLETGVEAATWLTTREEFADVFLLMASLAHRQGFSLYDVIDAKFHEVQAREWAEPDGDGVQEHIRNEYDVVIDLTGSEEQE